jgi:multidrug efflux pump subunit AcrA (membrane-fusion protein)
MEVLNKYTKEMELETRNGNLLASKSKLEADKAGLAMDEGRRDLALEELEYCVVKAERSGLVIYPSAAEWKETPDITKGATVRKDQVLLLMPDLSQMQVKVGIHESIVDRIKPGMAAQVTLPDKTITGEVSSVASVTRPAGWWTGNVVKYDTIVDLPSAEGLKPGMSAEVEVIMDEYEDVLTIPVAAVVETAEGDFCWVKTPEGSQRRSLRLGDTDDSFLIVKAGLKEGDEVVLNPLAEIEEAQLDVLKPVDETKQPMPDSYAASTGSTP